MLTCINKNSVEYQALKKKSGISEFILESVCRNYLDKYNRLPYLDELPGSNSEPYVRDILKVKENNSATIDNILQYTSAASIEEANAKLNDQFRDLEISITPIINEAFIDINHRPTEDNFLEIPKKEIGSVNNVLVFTEALNKLSKSYGINFKVVTNEELSSGKWNQIPNINTVKGFIYKGDIYINIDKADVSTPIHEMMHLLVGSIRFQSPNLYQELINLAKDIPKKENRDRTENDLNEEALVEEVSRLLTNQESRISDSRLQYEILYNVKRVLDSILMGTDSVKTISTNRLFNTSLKDLAKEVNSHIMSNSFFGFINSENSELHRKLSNLKSDLFNNNELIEQCK